MDLWLKFPCSVYQKFWITLLVAIFIFHHLKIYSKNKNYLTKKFLQIPLNQYKIFEQSLYENFGEKIPSLVINNKVQDKSYLDLVNWKLPYLKQQIKKLDPDNFIQCLKNKEKPTSIWFIGDSRLRQIFIHFLLLTQEINYQTYNENVSFIPL